MRGRRPSWTPAPGWASWPGSRYPGGVLVEVEYFKVEEGIARTTAMLADPAVAVVYEGFIQYQNVLVRPDILVRMPRQSLAADRGEIHEPGKAGAPGRPGHPGVCAQRGRPGCGRLPLCCTSTRGTSTLAVHSTSSNSFRRRSLTREVADRQDEIPGRLAAMRQVLAAPAPPAIAPDDHCFAPYECPFWEHCAKEMPARWISHLPGSRRVYQDLVALGIQTIDEIPAGYPLQLIQQRVKDQVEWIGPGLQTALDTVEYPLHHLDFETVGFAIPVYPNTHPYQAIPFQWSNHIETADGALRHEAYLCPDARDPREELAVALLRSVGEAGSICTYTGYERGVLTALADALPHLRHDLDRVSERLWDLHPVVKANYYHPGFEGSYSIKAVLPALVPALAYDDLEIQEGTMASVQFARMAFGDLDLAEQTRIRTALLNYCDGTPWPWWRCGRRSGRRCAAEPPARTL